MKAEKVFTPGDQFLWVYLSDIKVFLGIEKLTTWQIYEILGGTESLRYPVESSWGTRRLNYLITTPAIALIDPEAP